MLYQPSAVDIKFDESQLEDLRRILGGLPKALPRVLARALNRAVLMMRSRVAHRAYPKLFVPLSEVKTRLKHRAATPQLLAAHLYIFNRGFSRYWQKPKQTKTGVTFARGEPGAVPHAFIARMRATQEYPGVYIRVGAKRLPIKALRTEGVVQAIREAGGWDQEYAQVRADLEKRLRAETERILAGGKWSGVGSALDESWEEWRGRMGGQEFR